MINLGFLILAIALLGYLSNWINWRYLNYFWMGFLYRIGVMVHEFSHAVFCILTLAKIKEISVFSKQPHVTYSKPKIPLIGDFLISVAPIGGGLAFLFLLNKFILANYFVLPQTNAISDVFNSMIYILLQINLSQWQSWVMVFLFFNIGAMIGPSFQDLKNIWPAIIISFFINWHPLIEICFLGGVLILANIFIQIILFLLISGVKTLRRV